MRVTVRLFARLREIAGWSERAWEIDAGASVADVWTSLGARYPALAPFGTSVSCAVNADFARMTAVLREGDEVAFLPPVSGGGAAPATPEGRA